jgi:CBS domain containing-hemolysin-like protein
MTPLRLTKVKHAQLAVPGMDPWHVNPEDPATSVMTDFREHTSITVTERTPIDSALEHMRHTGVRSAFVTDEQTSLVVGLITAYDITSEKPMQLMQSAHAPRHDVAVADIMQPVAGWHVADMEHLERATVAAVFAMFAQTGLTHVPVVETAVAGGQRLRGLLSAARVKRVLNHLDDAHRETLGVALTS